MTIVPRSGSPARSPERARLLKALAERRSSRPGILRRNPAGWVVPASYAQAGLWMVAELEQGSPAYNVPLPVSLRGRLDTDALRVALTGVVERHEALRTTFTEHDGVLYQVVGAPAQVPLPVLDLTGEADADVSRRLAAAQTARFDLGAGPVLRAELLRLDPQGPSASSACRSGTDPTVAGDVVHGERSGSGSRSRCGERASPGS
ncbi:condensation domain-containing protein [Streptomyces sp. NBC_01485]|uniref:condensation domain-containing protein n=1 Tax=Streptomyces sp. NBC_01485 TaxID=2903884 RepID=UPI002E36F202|nr:condensation domain-containing protein [Streptomyces sp. NBC_01485]